MRKGRDELLIADPADLDEFEQAWRDYYLRHPEVVATWGHSNGRLPNDQAVTS